LGDKGYSDLIENQTNLGDYLRDKLKLAGFKIVNKTPFPVVCFTHRAIEEFKFTTTDVLNSIYRRKKFWISQTTLGKKIAVLRACVTSFRTTSGDIDELVNELEIAIKNQKNGGASFKLRD
jgi:glutamate/tyrosine decarboxylase-like PLP-dependent enzyme